MIPVAASVFGSLLFSGSALGVAVPDVGVPGVPPLVPQVETRSVPTVPGPVNTPVAPLIPGPVNTPFAPPVPGPVNTPPVAVPGAPKLVEPPQLEGSARGQPALSGRLSAGAPGSPSQIAGPGAAAAAASAMPRGLTPAQRKRFTARRRAAYERELRREVKDLLGCVYAASDFEAAVLVLRAGVSGKPLSRGRVAKRLRTSGTRVRRAERRGLRRLRSANRTTGCGAGGGSQGPATRSVGGTLAAVAGTPVGGPLREAEPSVKPERFSTPDRSGGAVAGATRSSSPPSGDGSAGVPFLLVLLGIALLASILAAVAKRPKRQELQCDYCRSTKVAVNPAKAVYRCASCGFSGVVPAQMAAEPGHTDDTSQDVEQDRTVKH